MPTGNAVQTATVVTGGGGSGTATVANALADTTGTVNVSNAAAPGAAGSVLVTSSATTATWAALPSGAVAVGTLLDATGSVSVGGATAPGAAGSVLTVSQVSAGGTLAIWSTTAGTVGSAGTAGTVAQAGTATTAGFATNAGTSTVANALVDASGTVNVAGATAPGAAGSILVSSNASGTAVWTTTLGTALFATNAGTASAGTVGSATLSTNAGTSTVSGTATVSNAWAVSGGTVNTSAMSAAGAAGSALVSQSATSVIFTTTLGTIGYATNLSDGTTLPAYLAPQVVSLSMAATIAVNAALGNDYRLTLTSSTATMGNPANPVDGQNIKMQLTQDSTGTRTIAAWGTSYDFGKLGTPVLSTATSAIDVIGFVYNGAKTKWLYLGSVIGF